MRLSSVVTLGVSVAATAFLAYQAFVAREALRERQVEKAKQLLREEAAREKAREERRRKWRKVFVGVVAATVVLGSMYTKYRFERWRDGSRARPHAHIDGHAHGPHHGNVAPVLTIVEVVPARGAAAQANRAKSAV